MDINDPVITFWMNENVDLPNNLFILVIVI